MTQLINIHKAKTNARHVYIGRAGHGHDGYFGNPFRLEDFGGDRVACLAAYRRYFYERLANDLEFRDRIHALKGETLSCFCWPDLCHGEVIIEHLETKRCSVVAFTGHRPEKLGGFGVENPVRDRILRRLLTELRALEPGHAITGMALGLDQWAARACLHLGIPYTAAVPFEGQASIWPRESRREYDYLLSKAARIQVICVLSQNLDVNAALQHRNEWMVDRCDRLIACWDGSRGGTYNCIKFAELFDCPMTVISP
jgi:uncharacterized phage-like protein YoqJ